MSVVISELPSNDSALAELKALLPADWRKSANTLLMVAQDAERGLEPVGVSEFRVVRDEAELLWIFVDGQFRRTGVARLMLESLVSYARSHGVSKVWLEVEDSNQAAISFYQKSNFVFSYSRPNYYPSGRDALVYVLEI